MAATMTTRQVYERQRQNNLPNKNEADNTREKRQPKSRHGRQRA